MASTGGGARRWLNYGCFGCLGIVVLFVIVSVVISGIAYNRARNEEVEDRQLAREIPAPAGVIPPAQAAELPLPETPGKVVLRLRQSEFRVVPAAEGEPIRVDARYDTKMYELQERFVPATGDAGWTYEVEFRRTTGSFLLAALKEAFGSKPVVEVHLPEGVPFELDLDIMQGGAFVELGGLWITSARIKILQGGGAVRFSEPLQAPMETLAVEMGMGGGAIEGLGNASPRRLDLEWSMGGGAVNLDGHWLRDAEIHIDHRMGGLAVGLPDGVIVRGLDGFGIAPQATDDIPLPVLTFHVSAEMGEIEFQKW